MIVERGRTKEIGRDVLSLYKGVVVPAKLSKCKKRLELIVFTLNHIWLQKKVSLKVVS